MFELNSGILKLNDVYAINLREVMDIWQEASAVDDCIDLCFMDWHECICKWTVKMSENEFTHEYATLHCEWECIMEDANMSDLLGELNASKEDNEVIDVNWIETE